MEPSLDYHPDISEKPNGLNKMNSIHQGLFRGSIDEIVDSFIKVDTDRIYTIINFQEFTELKNEKQFDDMCNLFLNFHPRTRPVLWRILVTQAYLYTALIHQMGYDQLHPSIKPLKSMAEHEKLVFDWRENRDNIADDEVFMFPFKAAENYFREHLGEYFETNE